MGLPKFLQPYLPSHNIEELSLKTPSVRRELVNQILNTGDDRAVSWLFKNFSFKEIKKYLSFTQRGIWFKRSLNYWLKIFNLKISPSKYKKAIFNLNPYVLSKGSK